MTDKMREAFINACKEHGPTISFSDFEMGWYACIEQAAESVPDSELERLLNDAALGQHIRAKYNGMKTSTSERFLEALGVELDEDAAWASYTLETLLGIDAAIAAGSGAK